MIKKVCAYRQIGSKPAEAYLAPNGRVATFQKRLPGTSHRQTIVACFLFNRAGSHRRCNRFSGLILVPVLILAVLVTLGSHDLCRAGETKQVLYLDSYHHGYGWSDKVFLGIKSVFAGKQVELRYEHMDTKRIHDEKYLKLLNDVYKHKFAGKKFDVIICSDDNAFRFLLKYGESLFPGTPIVFCGVNFFDDYMIERRHLITGVIEAFDLKSTIDMALRLNPETKEVQAITDRVTSGQLNKELWEAVIRQFPKSVSFTIIENWTVEGLRRKLAGLDRNTAVIPLSMFKEKTGKYVSMPDSVESISGVSRAPLYGTWDFLLGRGIVGGMITSGFLQGETAAKLALRIIAGEKPSDIPVIKQSPNRYMFDYLQLARFDLDLAAVPADAVIINKPPDWYAVHRTVAWALGILIVALILVVLTLGIHLRYRKRAEVALRESEEHYRNFFENALVGLFRSRMSDGLFLDINAKAAEQQGLPVEEIVGKVRSADRYRNPDQRNELIYRLRQYGEVHDFEADLTLHDGRDVTFSLSVKAYPDKDFMEGAVIDITDRKKAEEALRRNETFLEAIWRTSPVGMAVGRDRVFVWANKAWATMHGYSDPQEIVGQSTRCSYASEEEFERTGRVLYEALKTQPLAETDVHCRRKDGSLFRGRMWLTFVDPNNPDEGVIGAIIDITERERAEQDLKESEQRYRTLFEESIDGVYSVLRDGEITDANLSFCQLFGYTREEMIGKNFLELYSDPADRPKFQNEIEKDGFVKDYAVKFINKAGKELDCLVTSSVHLDPDGSITGYRGIVRDVTDQKLLQRQFLQAQKMEAIGTLAGGIAHDVNNLLQAVLGYSDLLLMKKGPGDPDSSKLKVIQQAARDGAELVSRILTFSRKGESKTRPLDLNEEILKAERLLRRTLPRMIEIDLVLAPDIGIVDADPAQLEQVILNLGVNAHHAMPEGGRLLLETKNVSLSDEYLRAHLGAKPGRYVLLTVSDTGEGMDSTVLERIFEPFFTTKSSGLGTGLGLSMVHGIVTQHGGYIRCYSEPGRGASFKIYFPVSQNDIVFDPTQTREMPAFGTETVLLVDDDYRIRDMAQQMIAMGGYKVLTAKSGEEALEVHSSHKEEIALIILDLIMPGMGGSRCLEELLRVDPNVKVLVASGYSSNGLSQADKGGGARGFVSKPYDAKDILGAIRRVLDKGTLE